ncbi:hypothetical protein N9U37_00275, partial [Prochlorococcus sp. AH-736-N10]|nr:hypothetical protein [Prochlorococcus sp. AH-736-N10]
MDLIKTLEILKINNLSKGDLDKRELLRLDEIPEKDLLEIGFACKFYQIKKRKTLCKKILN